MDVDKVKYWMEISDYDLDTAEAMFQTKAVVICGIHVPPDHREDLQGLLVQQD